MPRRYVPRRRHWMPHASAGRIQRFWRRRRGRYSHNRPKTGVKTGFLKVIQKVLSQEITLPNTPEPNGIVRKLKFEIADIPQFTTYSQLFDQYRLTGVKVTLLPTTNTNDSGNPGGTFIWSVDLDGDTQISTFDDILQCSNSHTSPWSTTGGMTPYKKMFVRPRTRDALVRDICNNVPVLSTALGYAKQWIDLGDRGRTEHFGLNIGWFIGNTQLGSPQEINMVTTYYIQFRKVR